MKCKELFEAFVNVLPNDIKQKEKFKQTVFELLQKTYEAVGGLKGNGFNSPDDMVKNIPFWKLVLRSGKISAGAMYKDKNGRKRVAIFNDQSDKGKADMFKIMVEDVQQDRAYVEVSKGSLGALKKRYGIEFIKKHAISTNDVKKYSDEKISLEISEDDPELLKHPELEPYFYRREIAGKLETKIMLGSVGKKIV